MVVVEWQPNCALSVFDTPSRAGNCQRKFGLGKLTIATIEGKEKKMTTAGLEPATFWYRWAIEAKRATIAPGSLIAR